MSTDAQDQRPTSVAEVMKAKQEERAAKEKRRADAEARGNLRPGRHGW